MKYHGKINQLVAQPCVITFEEDGIATLRQTYELMPKTKVIDLIPPNGAPHPVYTTLSHVLKEMSLRETETGFVYDCVYKGGFSNTYSGLDTPASYELIGGTSQEPIDSHDRFVAFIGGTKANPKPGARFDNDGKFLGFVADAPNDLGGLTSYLAPDITWRETFTYADGVLALTDLGKIATPKGPVPTVPAPYNWLLASISATRQGSGGKAVFDYKLSASKGWLPIVYG